MPDRALRCFVGVPIGDELRDELRTTVETLKAKLPIAHDALRWTEPEGWHVSLAFLGPTEVDAIPRLAELLTAVAANHPPFAVPTGGLGAFPSRREVRVLWYGMADRSRRLAELAVAVRLAASVDLSAPFRAHLTLARASGDHALPLPDALWRAELPSGHLAVERLVLYRSHLSAGAPRYEPLGEYPLQPRVTAGGSR